MHLILLVVGAATAVAGMAMIRMGVPVEDVAGAALFISGMVAVVGGLIIAAIAVAVRTLGRMAERLEIQPLPLPPVAAVGREDPAPRPVRAAPAPAFATPTSRPSLLGWFGRGSTPPPPSGTASVPRAAPAAEATPPVDLAPLARIPTEPAAPPPIVPPPIVPPPVRPAPPPPRPAVKPAVATNGTPETTVESPA